MKKYIKSKVATPPQLYVHVIIEVIVRLQTLHLDKPKLNPGPLNWESSVLTTRPLLSKNH